MNLLPRIIGCVESVTVLSIEYSMSNYTLLRADRATHLKIVAVSLIAGIMVVGVGIAARAPVAAGMQQNDNSGVVHKPMPSQNWTSRETATVR